MKICIVSSPGGHLYQAMMLGKWWVGRNRFWVSLKSPDSEFLLKSEKKYFAFGPENRNILNFMRNLFFSLSILVKEKPNLIFSTGAGIAPPFFLWAKVFRIRTIYLEPYDFVSELSMTGILVKPLTDHFLVQHKQLLKKYSGVEYHGSIV